MSSPDGSCHCTGHGIPERLVAADLDVLATLLRATRSAVLRRPTAAGIARSDRLLAARDEATVKRLRRSRSSR